MSFPQLPANWQDWTIEEFIGKGSFGSVYKAGRAFGDTRLYSAIKIIEIPRTSDEYFAAIYELGSEESTRFYYKEMVDSCMKEIQTMYSLRGISNIVSIEDYCLEQTALAHWVIYIRMELLQPFEEYSICHEMSERDVIRLGIHICRALEYCEKANLLHRDIKPQNIFVSSTGDFKLGDFGIAKRMNGTMLTAIPKGTRMYMAPEMNITGESSPQLDIYSLGIVMYRLMNHNRAPFLDISKQLITPEDMEEALRKRFSGEPLKKPAEASDEFSRIILKACSYEMTSRYHTATEMLQELESLYKKMDTAPSKNKQPLRIGRSLLFGIPLAVIAFIACIRLFDIRDIFQQTIHQPEQIQETDIYLEETETDAYSEESETDVSSSTENGNQASIMFIVGDDYYSDDNYEEAINWFVKAADAGSTEAMVRLGLYYQSDCANPPDEEQSLEWFLRAADAGNTDCLYWLGYHYLTDQEPDEEKALEWFLKGAEAGDDVCMFEVAYMYRYGGEHIAVDYEKAIDWFLKASVSGDALVYTHLGELYEELEMLEEAASFYQKALEGYKQEAANGDVSAMYRLGCMYEEGYEAERDIKEAMKWYLAAAQEGDPYAMHDLARLYMTEGDPEESEKWYARYLDAAPEEQ